MNYTLNKAAKLSGRAKSTISKAIKDGRLSADKDDNGSYQINAAELHRVFPFSAENQSQDPVSNTPADHRNSLNETGLLGLKITMLEAQLDTAHETVADLRKRLDRADERLTSLTVQRDNLTVSKGWFDRLLGR